MSKGCGWDLVVFGSTADRSGALALSAVPLAAGDTTYPANGAPGVGTLVYPKEDGAIFGIGSVSETAAAVEMRIHATRDPNWMRSDRFCKLQTAAFTPPNIGRVNYPVFKGDSLTVELTNAGAVLDAVAVFIAKGGKIPKFSEGIPPGDLPKGAMMVDFTATFTHVVDSWATGAITFANFALDRSKKYKIIGLHAHSATGCAHRLQFIAGDDRDNTPGILGGDTAQISQIVFGDFGEFDGLTPPNIQTIAVAADASTSGTLILLEG